MSTLTPEQRNYYYLKEAERAGIHKPILAALYEAQGQPSVNGGETGLGISPANRIPLEAVDTFAQQVHYAANTIRSLIAELAAKGWIGSEFWNYEKGRYTDLFVKTVAAGYVPPANAPTAARLESCKANVLLGAYLKDWETDLASSALPQNLDYLDRSFVVFVEQIPYFYYGLWHQREAMLEAVRIWSQLDTHEAAKALLSVGVREAAPQELGHEIGLAYEEDATDPGSRGRGNPPVTGVPPVIAAEQGSRGAQEKPPFENPTPSNPPITRGGAKIQNLHESQVDILLKQFVRRISQTYASYPYQMEALIRLIQLWRQLPSREAAIASLEKNSSPDMGLSMIDPALIAFIQRLPQSYMSSGPQRHALTETFRRWHRLDSRTAALKALGIPTESLTSSVAQLPKLANIAAQLDRELWDFIRRLPEEYKELGYQREALIHLVQLWRGIATRNQTIQSLFDDLKRMEKARRDAQDAPPPPVPLTFPKRPDQWTMQNICLSASIILDGNFTWAEATFGGLWMPPNQETVDAIVRIASLAQRARDRIGRPFLVSSWYLPPDIYRAFGGALESRHILGDALTFTCLGLSGNQLYWFLDPWWPGGLGRYTQFPDLCHIDARSYRARWEY